MLYAILTFAVVFLLMGSGLLFFFHREVMGARLSKVLSPAAGQGGSRPRLSDRIGIKKRVEVLIAFAGSFGKTRTQTQTPVQAQQPQTTPAGTMKKLISAGYRDESAAQLLSSSKIFAPLLLCAITLATGLYAWSPFIVIVVSLGIGYLLPDYWLEHRVRVRAEKINRDLPDLLDMLVVCLEAGLSLDQAALRCSQELRISSPELADEVGLVILEVRAGRPRLDAWKRMAERTDVDVLTQTVSMLVQAEQFGTGVSKALRTHGQAMRMGRRLKVEEQTAKSTVKMVFPMVLFIFPPFLIVMLGPAVLSILESFK